MYVRQHNRTISRNQPQWSLARVGSRTLGAARGEQRVAQLECNLADLELRIGTKEHEHVPNDMRVDL